MDKVDEIRANLEEKINASIAKETRPELKEAKEMARMLFWIKCWLYRI